MTDGTDAPSGSYNVSIAASNGGTQLVAQPLQFALVQGVIRSNGGNTLDLGTYGTHHPRRSTANNLSPHTSQGVQISHGLFSSGQRSERCSDQPSMLLVITSPTPLPTVFKSGTASFADMFAGSKVGLGVKVAGITQDFTDGTTTNTGRGLDVAISQNGFFRMVDSNGSVFYSRNGQFKLDENRNIVNMQGLQLTGYPATGTPPTIQQGANPAPITIPNTLNGGENHDYRVNADQPELH